MYTKHSIRHTRWYPRTVVKIAHVVFTETIPKPIEITAAYRYIMALRDSFLVCSLTTPTET